ncbi:hypothetical protein ACE2AJ_08505 [Aquihabitans daechungensis]|uniref:hypothetical protein n=1 Tax=Aquihabitans daechungensis TaxID=1052257 RepID=UPI003BA03318
MTSARRSWLPVLFVAALLVSCGSSGSSSDGSDGTKDTKDTEATTTTAPAAAADPAYEELGPIPSAAARSPSTMAAGS